MTTESVKEAIRRELPEILRTDPEFRAYILELTRQEYAGRAETQDRFYEMMAELRRDREAQARAWEEYRGEQNRKSEEQNRKWEEQNRRWDENQAEMREEFKRIREEQNRKWDENQTGIKALAKNHDRAIGALGARWGMRSEKSFRDALSGILEESFGVKVIHVNEYDSQGVVFGKPEQVELDVIIHNGLLLICELKSSISRGEMYLFERKARFYEQRHQRTANRLIVISPMIEEKALQVAKELGIETYGDSLDVKTL
ncbi:MAG: PD-(D/E)XK nuclease family protein [Methylococcales bacterium]